MNDTFVILLTNSTQESAVKPDNLFQWIQLLVQIVIVAIGAYLTYFFTIKSDHNKKIYELKGVYFEALDVLWKSRAIDARIFALIKDLQDEEIEIENLNKENLEPEQLEAFSNKLNKFQKNFDRTSQQLRDLQPQFGENIILMGTHMNKIGAIAMKNKNLVESFNEAAKIVFDDANRFPADAPRNQEEYEKILKDKDDKYGKAMEKLISSINEDLNQSI
jgi:hypothetical protein